MPDGDAMHHAVAKEPMLPRGIGIDRVCTHLEIAAVEPRRNRSVQGEILERQFRSHWRVDANKVGAAGLGQPLAVVSRDELDNPLDRRANGRLDRVRHESGSPAMLCHARGDAVSPGNVTPVMRAHAASSLS